MDLTCILPWHFAIFLMWIYLGTYHWWMGFLRGACNRTPGSLRRLPVGVLPDGDTATSSGSLIILLGTNIKEYTGISYI
jgi:hypothetical protein